VTLGYVQTHVCQLVCLSCGFCIHTFKCECQQNSLKGKFCVLIGALSSCHDLLPGFEQPENRQLQAYNKIKNRKLVTTRTTSDIPNNDHLYHEVFEPVEEVPEVNCESLPTDTDAIRNEQDCTTFDLVRLCQKFTNACNFANTNRSQVNNEAKKKLYDYLCDGLALVEKLNNSPDLKIHDLHSTKRKLQKSDQQRFRKKTKPKQTSKRVKLTVPNTPTKKMLEKELLQ
jgi:hypothetical protein